jgi:hypothetical protein
VALWLEIKGDYNDADYVTQRTDITQEQLESFKPLIAAIQADGAKSGHYGRGRWGTSEASDEDEHPHVVYKEFGEALIDAFDEFVPRCGYNEGGGIHCIENILLIEGTEECLMSRYKKVSPSCPTPASPDQEQTAAQ